MASGPATTTPAGSAEPNHGRRIIGWWIASSIVATPLVAIFLGPAIPPGNGSTQGTEQVFDNTWMVSTITPVICLLAVFFLYGLRTFRAPAGAVVDGPPLRSDTRIQVLWIAATSVIVLFFAGFGSYELLQNGAGGGQGPSPVAVPSGQKLEVQVIGQQWNWTFRYPSLGGAESDQLVLPANTYIELHVTSLDVVHSFWAYELGVKADANPDTDNVAYVQTKDPRTFHVRCAELCGLFHGYMVRNGRVVDSATWHAWAKKAEANYQPVAKFMPPYAHTYLPDPQRRAG
ncbi:MAG TPA: cytochrome c oxidase subunit II [Gaiellaceae bacterium]|nr:cytochrome c oxidase subunit II [Gaiellaceae bacterium]